MKMKHVYQLTDELSIGYELQLLRFRELLPLLRSRNLSSSKDADRVSGGVPALSAEDIAGQIQDLMEQIDDTAQELAELREELQQIMHLKQFDLEQIQHLLKTPSSARLEAILKQVDALLREPEALSGTEQAWLERHLREVEALTVVHLRAQGRHEGGAQRSD